MQFVCSQDDLALAVGIVQRAVAVRTTVPVLTGILMAVRDSSLILEGTDIELRISCEIPVEANEEGKAVVPAKYFTDLVKNLPDGRVEIGTTGTDTLFIRYGDSGVKLRTFDVDEFPELEGREQKYQFALSPELLSESVRQVSIAVSRDMARPVLTGILFNIDAEGRVTMVGTDSHRLAKKELQVSTLEKECENVSAIIPARVLMEAARIFPGAGEMVNIALTESHAYFHCKDVSMVSQLIDGHYPHYKEVIPDTSTTSIDIDSEELYDSLNRASLVSSAEMQGRGSIIKMEIEENTMHVHSFSTDVGEVDEVLHLSKTGDDLQIAFNGRYLLEALRVLDAGNVQVNFTGPLSPTVIKSVAGDGYLYLVLPVRTQ